MNIIVFGATGRVGSRLIKYGSEKGFSVSAFVRDSESFSRSNPEIPVVQGDVKEKDSVIQACRGKDIILSALSGRSSKPDYSVLSIAMENYLQAAIANGISRILFVAGAGVLLDEVHGLRRNRPGYPAFFMNVSAENLKVLNILEKSNVDWTCVAAPEMPEGQRTKNYRTRIDYLPENGSRISVEDVADFMIENIQNEKYFKKKIGIAY